MSRSSEVALFSLIAVIVLNGVCFGSKGGNLEYWQTTGISLDVNKDLAIHVEQEFRVGRQNVNPYLYSINLGLVYKSLADWVDIGFDFKKEYEKDNNGKFRQENRPHLNVTLKGRLFDLGLSSRSRFEYRDREDKKNLWRYRNKVTLKLPLALTKLKLTPYLADEVFINLDGEGFNKNRLYSGVSFDLSKHMKGSVYYMWQSSRSDGGWEDISVLGFALIFPF